MKKTGSQLARAHLIIEGRVQGVFFRADTVRISRENNVTGWVRNRPGGTVEAVLEGEKSDVERVIKWCRDGPPMARVDDIKLTWGDYEGEVAKFSAK